jgi:homoserine dehydrogenase
MSAITFGVPPVQFDRPTLSITSSALGRYARQLGYRIKLLGITKKTARGGIGLRVH